MAFPSNDFRQELDTNAEINSFLQQQFPQVDFPVFGITSLMDNPVYRRLREQLPEEHVHHNFFKYLVDRDGRAVALYSKKQDPLTLTRDIEELLQERYDVYGED